MNAVKRWNSRVVSMTTSVIQGVSRYAIVPYLNEIWDVDWVGYVGEDFDGILMGTEPRAKELTKGGFRA